MKGALATEYIHYHINKEGDMLRYSTGIMNIVSNESFLPLTEVVSYNDSNDLTFEYLDSQGTMRNFNLTHGIQLTTGQRVQIVTLDNTWFEWLISGHFEYTLHFPDVYIIPNRFSYFYIKVESENLTQSGDTLYIGNNIAIDPITLASQNLNYSIVGDEIRIYNITNSLDPLITLGEAPGNDYTGEAEDNTMIQNLATFNAGISQNLWVGKLFTGGAERNGRTLVHFHNYTDILHDIFDYSESIKQANVCLYHHAGGATPKTVEMYRLLQDYNEGIKGGAPATTNESSWNAFKFNCGGSCWNNGAWNVGGASNSSSGIEGNQISDYDSYQDRGFSVVDSLSITTQNVFYCWNVTDQTVFEFDNMALNYGYVLQSTDEANNSARKEFRSGEYNANTSQRPYIEINYSIETPPVFAQDIPINDTYIFSNANETNYEDNGSLRTAFNFVIPVPEQRVLINFVNESIDSNWTVSGGDLHLYLMLYKTRGDGWNLTSHKINDTWLVNETAWDLRRLEVPWNVSGGDIDQNKESYVEFSSLGGLGVTPVNKYYTWGIDDLILSTINKTRFGVLLQGTMFCSVFPCPALVSASAWFTDTTNETTPRLFIEGAIKNQTLETNTTKVLNMSNFFSDLQYDSLAYGVRNHPDMNISISGDMLTFESSKTGLFWMVLNASDVFFETESNNVTINITPSNVSEPPTPELNDTLTCHLDPTPLFSDWLELNEKLWFYCNITSPNNESYKCKSHVFFEGILISTAPEGENIEGIGIVDYFEGRPENQTYQLVNMYYKGRDLRHEREVDLLVDCKSKNENLKYQSSIIPHYIDVVPMIDREIWIRNNASILVALFIILMFAVGVTWWAIKT
jgi:hypothetical protein